MTTQPAAKEAMNELFVTAWASASALTLDNEDLDPPDGAPWVRMTIRHTGGGQETMGKAGNRKFEKTGSVFVQVFTAGNTGSAAGDVLAKTASDIFEGVSIAGTTVSFLDVQTRETGPDGKWYQILVEANFRYDETK